MVAMLLPALFLFNFMEGDHWSLERTLHYSQGDIRDVDRLEYRVTRVEAEETVIGLETIPTAGSQTKKSKKLIGFRPNGTLAGDEDEPSADLERINRMLWTALEPRKAISWSRNWRACSNLVEAKVVIKPTLRLLDDTTLSVTYMEGKTIKAVATVKVLNRVPVLEELTATVYNALAPGASKPGSLTVTETLKDIYLTGK